MSNICKWQEELFFLFINYIGRGGSIEDIVLCLRNFATNRFDLFILNMKGGLV